MSVPATCLHDIVAQIVATLHSHSHKESDFILFGVLFEKIELPRFGVPRRMKYLVARQRCTPIAHPRRLLSLSRSLSCSFSSEVLNFIFGPLVAALSGTPRCETSGGYFFCDFTPASAARSSRSSSRCADKKKEENRWRLQFHSLPATFLRDDNTSAIDNRNDIISEKEIPSERGIFDGAEQYRKNCFQKENNDS